MNNIAQELWAEIEQEARVTRNLLAVVPFDKKEFKPHEKSMTLERLAVHIAEMNTWVKNTLKFDGLNFAEHPYEPFSISSTEELIAYFDKTLQEAQEILSQIDDQVFTEDWTLRNGDQIYFTLPKGKVVRTWCLNHVFHHRGQLSVYLRLLNVPLPSIYGPTADMI